MKPRKAVYQSRAGQVLEHLRERLRTGHWGRRLPPERDLAAELDVSRWTLRAALKELQREGWLGERSQAGTQIIQKAGRRSRAARQLSIGIVISSRANLANGRILFMLDSVRHHLQAQEARMELHKTPYPPGGSASAHFRQLTRKVSHDCWGLVAPTVGMQRWCVESGIPAVVIGTGDPATGLPCASVDNYAVCHHAVGMMLRHGHRHLALILPRQEKGEDAASRLGFEAGVRESPHPEATFTMAQHDQSSGGVCALADRLLLAQPHPTAWLVCRQGHFTTLFTYLMSRGVRMPHDLSLISRDSDEFFVDLVPDPTRYLSNRPLLAHQYARLALRVAAGQALHGERIGLMPEYHPGATLGPIPRAPSGPR